MLDRVLSPANLRRVSGFARYYLAAAAYTPYLLTLGIRSPRNRTLLAAIALHAGVAPLGPKKRLPRVPLKELVDDNVNVTLLEPEGVDGNVTLLELLALAKIARSAAPRRILEIGTFDGRTTLNLTANSPPDARVYTLDLPAASRKDTALPLEPGDLPFVDKPQSGTRFHGSMWEKRIVQLFGDSASFDFSPYRENIDLVFVDGAHSYEYVIQDSMTALSLLPRSGGFILWHDYGVWAGVTQALNELLATDARFAGLRHIDGTALAVLDATQR